MNPPAQLERRAFERIRLGDRLAEFRFLVAHRRRTLTELRSLALALAILTLVAAAPAGAAGPVAHASGSCKLTTNQEFHSGATYLLKLSVTKVTCSTGLKVEKAFQSCRRSTAGHMTCKKHVLGYACSQKVLDSSKTQYDAKTTCKSGGRVVTFVYTQNK